MNEHCSAKLNLEISQIEGELTQSYDFVLFNWDSIFFISMNNLMLKWHKFRVKWHMFKKCVIFKWSLPDLTACKAKARNDTNWG